MGAIDTALELIATLQLEEKRRINLWSVADIVTAAGNIDVELREGDEYHIARFIEMEHDATVGLDWEIMEDFIRRYYEG